MSIIGQAAAADAQYSLWVDALILVLAAAAVAQAIRMGAFRRGSIVGPPRMGDRDPLGPLAVLLGAGFMVWIVAQIACLIPLGGPSTAAVPPPTTTHSTITTAPATQPEVQRLSPARMAVASSLPGLIAWAFLALANVYVRPGGLDGLGLSARHLRRGIRTGLLASCVTIPIVYLGARLTEILWYVLHYAHPKEHDLLKVLGENANPAVAVVLVSAAVVVAPLFEEILFRAHLQTLVAYALSRFRQRVVSESVGRGFDVLPSPASPPPAEQGGIAPNAFPAPSSYLFYPVPTDGQGGYGGLAPAAAAGYRDPTRFARWAAVLFASLAFSAVHPAWTIPPIFLLSVCLGYAYERTGNLWTTITMHATFNAFSTLLFLLLPR